MASPVATGADLVTTAQRVLGAPYVYGADGPRTFDCSGLVMWCCDQIGITSCPRTSEEQFAWTSRVDSPNPGDLVFFTGAEGDPPPGHVGIVVVAGQMIDAPHTGTVVQQGAYSENGTGVNQFLGYGRIPKISSSPAGSSPGGSSGSTGVSGAVTGTFAIGLSFMVLFIFGALIIAAVAIFH